jgi:hypothetical protein
MSRQFYRALVEAHRACIRHLLAENDGLRAELASLRALLRQEA